MRIKIGPYVPHIGPYQIAAKLIFWDNKTYTERDTLADKLGEKLANISWLNRFCNWIYDKRSRTIKVDIDNWDTWNANHTFALIIAPVLKKLKQNKYGAPLVDDCDVPEHLMSTAAEPRTEEEINCGHVDSNHFARWDYVLDEMIWTFEQHADENWEDQYSIGVVDLQIKNGELIDGPNNTYKMDYDALNKHRARMDNGRRLFAKYYESLWT